METVALCGDGVELRVVVWGVVWWTWCGAVWCNGVECSLVKCSIILFGYKVLRCGKVRSGGKCGVQYGVKCCVRDEGMSGPIETLARRAGVC